MQAQAFFLLLRALQIMPGPSSLEKDHYGRAAPATNLEPMKNDGAQIFPACHIELPPVGPQRAAFYLATEEYVAASMPPDNYFFSWILSPTVVFGRHQIISQEIDLDFCRRNNIDVIRRRSGGGCIFADNGNIMFSLVTGAGAVEPLFAAYAQNVAHALRALGADVSVSGRNDIVLNGHGKICGNAFYHSANRNIVHGTMLYDTNAALMSGALKPDMEKLKSAGVKSVRSRIGLLKNAIPDSIGTLRAHLIRSLTNRSVALTAEDVKAIQAIEAKYYKDEFLYGRRHEAPIVYSSRIDGCGKIEIRFDIAAGSIRNVELSGDFFEQDDSLAAFRKAFLGGEFSQAAITTAIQRHHPEKSIRGLSAEALTDLLGKT